MIKVAMIGAGSVEFSKRLTGDILAYPEFKDATLTYMDIDQERLNVGAALCRKMAKSLGSNATIEATLDLRQALQGADFVITMLLVGGFDSVLADFEIPRKFGLRQTIADTAGPAAVMKALRLYPVLSGIAKTMEEVCPNAVLLNYSNPMSMNMQSIFRTSGIRAVGLCHSIQGTYTELMGYLQEDAQQCTFVAGGINHMSFFLRLEKQGQDLYPALFKAMDNPLIERQNTVRFELMRRLGYFPTESTTHHSEYSAFFLPHGEERIKRFGLMLDSYLEAYPRMLDEWENMKAQSKSDATMEVCKSHEYGSEIIHSMVTGQPRVVYGNMPNAGAIDNLPRNAIVEAPTLVDRSGLRFGAIGELPPQCVGYVQPHVISHELFIRAAIEGRRDHIYQAAMFDPNTAASVTTDRIVAMCDELIDAHSQYMPKLDKKTLVPGSSPRQGRTEYKQLRSAWETQQRAVESKHLTSWKVLGPFAASELSAVSLDQRTAFEDAFSSARDGAIDLAGTCADQGETRSWRAATTDKHGFVDLKQLYGKCDGYLAYAYTEIASSGGEAFLRLGSYDGVRLWINGVLVHSNDLKRDFCPGGDLLTVPLKAGTNRVLMKITTWTWRWGFQLGVQQGQPSGLKVKATAANR
jgi:alpha-galactosidase